MSALRIAQPHEPVRFIDLGPAPRPVRLHGLPGGRLCVPDPIVYRSLDVKAAQRVRAFRLRHEGRVAR
jgi:hypothetical protein